MRKGERNCRLCGGSGCLDSYQSDSPPCGACDGSGEVKDVTKTKVYLVFHIVRCEGSSLISIHQTRAGAFAAAKKFMTEDRPHYEWAETKSRREWTYSDQTVEIEPREVAA
jgi:hypothetical protein